MLYLLLQFIIKSTNEHLDGDVHVAKSGRVQRAGASVPLELECATLWRRDVSANLEAPQIHHLRVFMKAPLCSHD